MYLQPLAPLTGAGQPFELHCEGVIKLDFGRADRWGARAAMLLVRPSGADHKVERQ